MEIRCAVPSDTGKLIFRRSDTLTQYFVGHSRASIHRPWGQMCIEHWWNEDVQAFRNELDALKRPAYDQDGAAVDTDAAVSEFLQRKKKKAADIKEVSL
jgi:hypothetical protein